MAARLGSPPINLAPRSLFPGIAMPEGATTVGVRTEHAHISKANGRRASGRVKWVEHLGDQIICVDLGERDFVTLADPDSGLGPGDEVAIALTDPLSSTQWANGCAHDPSPSAPPDRRCVRDVIAHADELTALDQAVGDGDHGLNMKRGFEAVRADAQATAEKPLPEALKAIGTQLVMKVGVASGPLYGTLFLALSKEIAPDGSKLPAAFGKAVEAVKARGKSQPGQKTLLDVLTPVQVALAEGGADLRARLPIVAASGAEATIPMLATRGRARSRRAIDRPYGPRRTVVRVDRRIHLPCVGGLKVGECRDRNRSHSPKIAEGAADMVRQMVGDSVNFGLHRRRSGGRARNRRGSIRDAIDRAWSEAGVAILVDLGGAETNSEMAVEMLDDERRGRVVVCNAPIVEGAVMAATEASGGSTLEAVRRTAEELSAQ